MFIAISFVLFVTYQKLSLIKTLKLELDSAAPSGGEGRLTYFVSFLGLASDTAINFTVSFSVYTRWEVIASYLWFAAGSLISEK